MIARAKPDATHNCHGWLFTGGRYWVAGDQVEDILADNGYAQVWEGDGGAVNLGTMSGTRLFDVTNGEALTVYLVCAASNTAIVQNPAITATFTPTP